MLSMYFPFPDAALWRVLFLPFDTNTKYASSFNNCVNCLSDISLGISSVSAQYAFLLNVYPPRVGRILALWNLFLISLKKGIKETLLRSLSGENKLSWNGMTSKISSFISPVSCSLSNDDKYSIPSAANLASPAIILLLCTSPAIMPSRLSVSKNGACIMKFRLVVTSVGKKQNALYCLSGATILPSLSVK